MDRNTRRRISTFNASHGTTFKQLNKTQQRDILSLIAEGKGKEARSKTVSLNTARLAHNRELAAIRRLKKQAPIFTGSIGLEAVAKHVDAVMKGYPRYSPAMIRAMLTRAATRDELELFTKFTRDEVIAYASNQQHWVDPSDGEYYNPLWYHDESRYNK